MIKDDLLKDLKSAMKENNVVKKNTIQLLRATILQKEKDELKALTDPEVENLLISERKKRYNDLSQFEKGNRDDLVEQTKREIGYISRYLPPLLDEIELEKRINEIITRLNATKKDMGLVMRTAKSELGNQADGKTMSDIVKRKLN